ncbi:MFS transporter [Pectobacterium wasabiae]|uniref:MFS transporter n=1 Tax=Pectobacterium wasabiae TaxID=55208 RepID=A0AAW3EFM9_9GAMM|nr:MFS transporter [Pectobacterium wasabiae]AOR63103.1 MFS transporter [Pectobacterium wasabiae CFBP 3304]EJS92131.1 MFS superfamily methyl viologen resistance protein SmvA [Pectobacterium wasabiae CFBP 3304]KFX03645.1 MFS transporter [Pectobacterium wasabiae]KGA26996.1 MFS transporter [Pectobacterium wasabiae]
MQSPKKWLILAIVSSALFLIVIDMTVLYTALPTLTHDLHATASDKLWIVNIYALVASGLLLGMGTLGDKLGHKPLFISGLVVFGTASLLAAYSPSPGILIAARALLAVGAAMMMPATLSIIRLTFADERERALAIGIWAAVASGGAAFGPVMGGILLEYFWWGSVFLINVPVVLLALTMGITVIPHRAGNASHRWDVIGSLLIMVGLIGVTYAIKELGKRVPSYEDALIALLIGIAFITLFVRRQRNSTHPLVDFSLFRLRPFSAAVAAAIVAAAALIGMELAFTQRLQLVVGLSPLQAGLFILPLSLASFISGPLTGKILPHVNSGKILAVGLLISGLGMGSYLLLHNAPIIIQVISLTVIGAGVGSTMTAASSTIMHVAPAEKAGMAASIEEVSYELGGATGVTLMGSLLSFAYSATFMLPTGFAVPDTAYDSLDEALIFAESLPENMQRTLITQAHAAFDSGFSAVLAVATLILLLTSAFVWITRHNKQQSRKTADA